MYCATCGNELVVSKGLVFCNKCGARIGGLKGRNDSQISEASVNFLIAATLGIPIIGIGLMIALIAVLRRGLEFPPDFIAVIALMCFLLLLAAEAGFLFMLFSRTRRSSSKDDIDPAQL